MDDGKKVLAEFGFWGDVLLSRRVENDERCPRSLDNPLDELGAEPRKPVPMGNHNLCDMSFLHVLQKPRERPPFEVDPGRDVFVDFVIGVFFLHRFDLALKIVSLLS